MSRNHNIDPKRLPRHVAIIMDGNGHVHAASTDRRATWKG